MTDKRNLLAGMNLNLFPVLEALLRHRSATKASVELGVTQSAVSHSLRELRALFDDPLFVRTREGLGPTTRALALELELRNALRTLGDVVEQPEEFEPAASSRRVTIATADDSGVTLLPRFVARVMRRAPGMSINIRPRPDRWFDLLEHGHVDLMLNLTRDVPSWAASARLYSDEMSCVICAHNPDVGDVLDLDTYMTSPHIRVSPEGFGASEVERRLEGLGVDRHIAVYTSSFSMAPEFVLGTRAILTLPSRLARVAARRLDVKVFAPPVDFPGFDIDVVWHRGRDDASLAWVREELFKATQDQDERARDDA